MTYRLLVLSLASASTLALANPATQPGQAANGQADAAARLRTQVTQQAAQLRTQSETAGQRFNQFTAPPMPKAAMTLPPPPAPLTVDLPATPANVQPATQPKHPGRRKS